MSDIDSSLLIKSVAISVVWGLFLSATPLFTNTAAFVIILFMSLSMYFAVDYLGFEVDEPVEDTQEEYITGTISEEEFEDKIETALEEENDRS